MWGLDESYKMACEASMTHNTLFRVVMTILMRQYTLFRVMLSWRQDATQYSIQSRTAMRQCTLFRLLSSWYIILYSEFSRWDRTLFSEICWAELLYSKQSCVESKSLGPPEKLCKFLGLVINLQFHLSIIGRKILRMVCEVVELQFLN